MGLVILSCGDGLESASFVHLECRGVLLRGDLLAFTTLQCVMSSCL